MLDDDGISYICMTSEDTEWKIAFTFLNDLKRTFTNTYTPMQIMEARTYELEFAEQIQKKIWFFNDNPIGFDTKAEEAMWEL